MKINLDEKEIYDLSELTSEELKEVSKESKLGDRFLETHKDTALLTFSYKWQMNANIKPENTTNAKELFYTLENIQIDCRDLTEEQIREMLSVYESKGYRIYKGKESLNVSGNNYLLGTVGQTLFFSISSKFNYTITYEKFMELFDNKLPPYKKASLKWNYDTLVGGVIETTDEVSPISSREKELKKTLKYLLKKDIILTPKQYKKLWKKS